MSSDEVTSECIKGADGQLRCPACNELLYLDEDQIAAPPRGMPSCLKWCLCPACYHVCCAEREVPEPILKPEPEPISEAKALENSSRKRDDSPSPDW